MQPLLDQLDDRLSAWMAQQGWPSYRAEQVRRWLFQRRAGGFEEMTDLSKTQRAALADSFELWTTKIATHRRADDGTEKLLLDLSDGARIECVLIREGRRRTVCLSTQVGCAMGCVFCASGLDGVQRNLTTGEMVEQMLRLNQLLDDEERISHVVVMGMGEPLANLDRLLPALDEVTRTDGLGISARRVTVSTVGLPEAIGRLAHSGRQYHLAVSLHAPDDSLRDQLVPVNRGTGVEKIVAAADEYFALNCRRLTFEYVLLDKINDRPKHARQLAKLLSGRTALVNLIPYNSVAGLAYREPSSGAVARFAEVVQSAGIAVQVRRRKGDRIDAACGQLRRSMVEVVRPRE